MKEEIAIIGAALAGGAVILASGNVWAGFLTVLSIVCLFAASRMKGG
jgi:hypothetical protein